MSHETSIETPAATYRLTLPSRSHDDLAITSISNKAIAFALGRRTSSVRE